MKIRYKEIFQLTWKLTTKPSDAWDGILEGGAGARDCMRHYLAPLAAACSAAVFLISLLHYPAGHAVGMAAINFTASVVGTWGAYRLLREYLSNKADVLHHRALQLTVYSAAVFIVFRSVGFAFGNLFAGQLLTLLSFIFIHTLYAGIQTLKELPANQKTNVLVIATLGIIFLPIVITQLLMIVLRIPSITL